MTGARVCGTAWCFVMAVAFVTGAAVAQADWPTMWEVRDKGHPISTEALERVVDGKTVIFDIGGYADGSGYLFDCHPDTPFAIWYDNGFSAVEPDTAVRIDGSSLCITETGRETCLAVMMMPGWTSPFILLPLHADDPDGDPLTEDDLVFLKETPASRLVTLPIPARALVDINGEIDLGVVAFTLPGDLDLALRGANDFPVSLSIREEGTAAFRVLVEIIGWPDPFRTPGIVRAPGPDDDALAQADLLQYLPTLAEGEPSPPGEYGERYVSTDYGVAALKLPGGPCLRVEEHMSVLSDPDGMQILPETTFYARQYCVTPVAGALFAVTVAIGDPRTEAQIAAFWGHAKHILDSVRIGAPGAQGR